MGDTLYFILFPFDKKLLKRYLLCTEVSIILEYSSIFDIQKSLQNATQNISEALIKIKDSLPNTISVWVEAYLQFEVTTAESSQKMQQRDFFG